jgi:hypothetical protein
MIMVLVSREKVLKNVDGCHRFDRPARSEHSCKWEPMNQSCGVETTKLPVFVNY